MPWKTVLWLPPILCPVLAPLGYRITQQLKLTVMVLLP
jgi:hypothetical protein